MVAFSTCSRPRRIIRSVSNSGVTRYPSFGTSQLPISVSLADVDVDSVIAPPCRELILTADVRDRAAALAAENQADASLVEMLDKISAGIPVEGMEALLPVLKTR